MNYKTHRSLILPQIQHLSKTLPTQSFTAIQIDDPQHQGQLQRPSPQQSRLHVHYNYNTANSRLDDHASNQASDWDVCTRELLMQHIQYIMAIADKLNTNVECLKSELRARDIAVAGTNKAVNKLEVHHVVMLQDFRGRILRCDTALAKHTKDMASLMDDIQHLEILVHQIREKLVGDIHRLEAEVMSHTGKLEQQNAEQRLEMSHLRHDTINKLRTLEEQKCSSMVEFYKALDKNKSDIDRSVEKMEAKFMAMIDKATAGWDDQMSRVNEHIERRVSQFQLKMSQDDDKFRELQCNIENQVMAVLQDTISNNNAELTKTKMEFRNSFSDIQESLTNMMGVVEGRRKLMGNQVKWEIGQVKKALFMEMPAVSNGTAINYGSVNKSDE